MTRLRNYLLLETLLAVAACSGAARAPVFATAAPNSAAPAQWIRQTVPSTASCRSVSAVSATVAWAGCTGGHVFRTLDGGATWAADTVLGAARLDFRGIKAFDANTAVIASAGPAEQGQAHIYRTVDGGKNWSLTWSDTSKGIFLDGIAFWDSRHGFTFSDPVNGRLVVLTTDDGGSTWAKIPAANIPPVLPNEAAFAASNTQLAVQGSSNAWIATGGGVEARVFHSTDRGRTWSVSSSGLPGGTSAGLFGIAFADSKNGLALGGDYAIARGPSDRAIRTIDGGITWTPVKSPDGTTTGLAFIPNSSPPTFAAVGAHGTAITHDFGATWTYGDSVTYWGVSFAGSAGWAAGSRGRVVKYTGAPK
jgi:photosystem II stability/assembly factor-like uncharacterized protein